MTIGCFGSTELKLIYKKKKPQSTSLVVWSPPLLIVYINVGVDTGKHCVIFKLYAIAINSITPSAKLGQLSQCVLFVVTVSDFFDSNTR